MIACIFDSLDMLMNLYHIISCVHGYSRCTPQFYNDPSFSSLLVNHELHDEPIITSNTWTYVKNLSSDWSSVQVHYNVLMNDILKLLMKHYIKYSNQIRSPQIPISGSYCWLVYCLVVFSSINPLCWFKTVTW